MKKIIPIATILSFAVVLTGILLLRFSDAPFSIVFKSTLLAISAFIALLCYWKSNFKIGAAVLGILSFVAYILILLQDTFEYPFWNLVLAMHILLMGIVLFLDVKESKESLLRTISQITVSVTIGALITLIMANFQQQWLLNVTLILLLCSSVLLLTNKIKLLLSK